MSSTFISVKMVCVVFQCNPLTWVLMPSLRSYFSLGINPHPPTPLPYKYKVVYVSLKQHQTNIWSTHIKKQTSSLSDCVCLCYVCICMYVSMCVCVCSGSSVQSSTHLPQPHRLSKYVSKSFDSFLLVSHIHIIQTCPSHWVVHTHTRVWFWTNCKLWM